MRNTKITKNVIFIQAQFVSVFQLMGMLFTTVLIIAYFVPRLASAEYYVE